MTETRHKGDIMFSSKDYEELADIMRGRDIKHEPSCDHARREVCRQRFILLMGLAEFLKQKDPRLSVGDFLKDCGA